MVKSTFVVRIILKKMLLKNYLVFQPMQRYVKSVSNTNDHILSWKSKAFSVNSIQPPSTSTSILNPSLSYVGSKIRLQLK